MSVSQIDTPHQQEGSHPPYQYGGAAAPHCQSESFCRIRENRCTNCCDHVPTGFAHPNPCPKPPTCHHCQAPGHLKRDCPVPTTPAHPEMPQQVPHQPAPNPRGKGGRRNQGNRRPHNPLPLQAANPPAVAGQPAVNMLGQRQTYHQPTHQQTVHTLQQPHGNPRPPSRHGNRLSNVYWGRTYPPIVA